MKFHDQTFEREEINLDDNVFTGCTFNLCRLVFRGGDVTRLAANHFNNCVWEFAGPAKNTLAFMRELYHGGGKEVIEQTFENIRA